MAEQNRRDFMKKTGGALASTSMPNLGAVGRAVNTITKQVKPENLVMNFLPAFIKKMDDIPFTIGYNGGTKRNEARIDVNMLWEFFYTKGRFDPAQHDYRLPSRSKANPEEILDNIQTLTGDKALVQKIKAAYNNELKDEYNETPGDAIYYALHDVFKGEIDESTIQDALGALISQKGYSILGIARHAGELGNNSSELLREIIKASGGPQNIFKTDMRDLKTTWKVMPEVIKKSLGLDNIEDLEKLYRYDTLKDISQFPDAAKILNLPEWLIKSVQKGRHPSGLEHIINQDSKDYINDYVTKGRTKADETLKTKHTPKTTTLGHWNKEGKQQNALEPGQSYGHYTSEGTHCHTNKYKNLIESLNK